MKNIWRRRWVRVSLFPIALLVVWQTCPGIHGRLAANWDLARGRPQRLAVGLPATWAKDAERLLLNRYGIETRRVAGCVVTERLLCFVAAYNEVSRKSALAKYGRDVFRECFEDAEEMEWRRMGLSPAEIHVRKSLRSERYKQHATATNAD